MQHQLPAARAGHETQFVNNSQKLQYTIWGRRSVGQHLEVVDAKYVLPLPGRRRKLFAIRRQVVIEAQGVCPYSPRDIHVASSSNLRISILILLVWGPRFANPQRLDFLLVLKPPSGTVSRPRSLLRRLWWIRGWLCRGGRGKEAVVVDVA